jgi:ribosome-binding factor A
MNHRPERVSSLIQEELSRIILREVELPVPGALATITDVEVDKKLEGAKVEVSVIPSDAETEKAVLGALDAAAGELQYLLMKKINIKPMPRIRFALDHGYENAAHVEKLLEDDTIKDEPKGD